MINYNRLFRLCVLYSELLDERCFDSALSQSRIDSFLYAEAIFL